jgi:hypothetical protein
MVKSSEDSIDGLLSRVNRVSSQEELDLLDVPEAPSMREVMEHVN